MALNDVYRVQLRFSASGTPDRMVTNFHYAQRGVAAASLADVAAKHEDFWDDIRDRFCGSVFMHTIALRRVDPLEPIEQLHAVNPAIIAGTAAADCLPLNAAVLISHRTGKNGRSYRGRNYLPAFAESQNDTAGLYTVAACSDVETEIDDLRTNMGAAGTLYDMVVYSPLLGTAENVTDSYVDRIPRSQRRRQPRAATYVDLT